MRGSWSFSDQSIAAMNYVCAARRHSRRQRKGSHVQALGVALVRHRGRRATGRNRNRAQRAMAAMLQMKKIVVADLEAAANTD